MIHTAQTLHTGATTVITQYANISHALENWQTVNTVLMPNINQIKKMTQK